jgi:hypothetical protein
MKILLSFLSSVLFFAFVIIVASVILSGCGAYGDERCFTYDDGETICYYNEDED